MRSTGLTKILKSIVAIFLVSLPAFAEEQQTLRFADYMQIVKANHPLAKSAGLQVAMGEAGVLAARGAFDPKIESGFSEKEFKDSDYYNLRNGHLKIPTWYGIELKAGFENNDGNFLNPQNIVPENGLNGIGISIPIAQGMLINRRMADLRNAKLQLSMSRQQQLLNATSLLAEAAEAYVIWQAAHAEHELYKRYADAAAVRFDGILKVVESGERPAVDSIEASIIRNTRLLGLEQAKLKLAKAGLELSVFLWAEENVPLELSDRTVPEDLSAQTVAEILNTDRLMQINSVDAHPKVRLWQDKIAMLENERKLKANALLPRIDLDYSYLTSDGLSDNRFQGNKVGIEFSYPLFLRKERGGLKLAKLKLQDAEFELQSERLLLGNKIKGQIAEITSLEKQQKIVLTMLGQSAAIREAEERLYTFGESSLFLVNNRENNLISAELAKISIDAKLYLAHAGLFRSAAVLD